MRIIKNTIIFLLILLFVGGPIVFFQGIGIICETVIKLFPAFVPVFKQTFESYFSSARFIASVAIFILSSVGIYLTNKEKRYVVFTVSILFNLISLTSIIMNLLCCG